MKILEQMLLNYKIRSDDDYFNALREVTQEIILAGLYRGNFFAKAAFYGGTALRIFYGLNRYSEDMDFSLLVENNKFSLENYLPFITKEFLALDLKIDIEKKEKNVKTNIESAFLKTNTNIYQIDIYHSDIKKNIKIKIEIDTVPPLEFATEEKLVLLPFSYYVKCFCICDLFAGKMHALLYRNWKTRVKGRDWYDFEWYIKRGEILNLKHFVVRAKQSGHIVNDNDFDKNKLIEIFKVKLDQLDIDFAKNDIRRFISDDQSLEIWSKTYFLQLIERIKIQ